MQLSEQQIQKLYDFVQSKYVRYDDVQCELVDHLASSIEDLMANDASVDFDEALRITYSKFPITGFYHYVESQMTEQFRYWTRRSVYYFFKFFRLPKIILAICLSMVLYHILTFINHHQIVHLTLLPVLLISVIYSCVHQCKFVKNHPRSLFIQSYAGGTGVIASHLFSIPVLTNIFIDFFDDKAHSTYNYYSLIFISILLSLWIISLYCTTVVFPEMLKEEIEKKYAHLNLKLS